MERLIGERQLKLRVMRGKESFNAEPGAAVLAL